MEEMNKTVNSGSATESVATDGKDNVSTVTNTHDDPSKTYQEDEDIFEDSENEIPAQTNTESEKKGKPGHGDSHRYAEERRKREAEEKQRQFNLGLKEGLGGINPYTKEKINDDYDLQMYRNMKEAEEQGYDPINEYWKYVASKDRKTFEEKQKLEIEEKQRQEYAKKDLKEFESKYNNVDTYKLLNDDRFKIFAEGKIGNKPLVEIYESYLNYESFIDQKAKELAEKKFARVMSSSGNPKNSLSSETKEKSPLNMSSEELKEYERKHNLHW